MKTLAVAGVALSLLAHQREPPPRELIALARPLTNAEAAAVLSASREAITGKTFRLSFSGRGEGAEILMAHGGRPKIIRGSGAIIGGVVGGLVSASAEPSRPVESTFRIVVARITDYTGLPASHCGGAAAGGELVIEYDRTGSQPWTAAARLRDARDFGGLGLSPVFEMLQREDGIAAGERARIGGRWARALRATWKPPESGESRPPILTGDPIPNVAGEPVPEKAVQVLWIDEKSLLPARWEAFRRDRPASSYDFDYRRIDLRLPRGIRVPTCIP